MKFEGEHFSTLPFHEFMVPEQGHDWFPSWKVLMAIWKKALTDPIWEGKIHKQPARANIFAPKVRKEKKIEYIRCVIYIDASQVKRSHFHK